MMAVAHSWPLASDPAHLARFDNDDAALNTWVIAWVAHVLPRNPLGLFDAPIFFPEQNTLAYSEHMLVPSLMGAPLLWAGMSPVLVHNLLLLAGFALSGFAMWWVITKWTGSASAGLVAGLLYAFNAHTLTRFPHLQAQHVEFFPLILYALNLTITKSGSLKSPNHEITRSPDVWLLAAVIVLQSLCSNYLMVFSLFAVAAAVAVRDDAWAMAAGRVRAALLVAAAIAGVALLPFLWPYYEVSRDQGLTRSIEEVAHYSAGWRDYLATGGRLHYGLWSEPFFAGRTALFPGVVALLLAGVAVVSGVAWRDRRARMALAVGVVGAALSLGPSLPGYAFLHDAVPLLGGIRNAARFGWLALAAVAILAGFGAHQLSQWIAAPRVRTAVMAVLAVLVTIEAWRAPVGFTRFEGLPRIYDRIAREGKVVLAEFPLYAGRSISDNGPYVLANTKYLEPLVNGYSGFQPASYEERSRVLGTFPSNEAMTALRTLGVTHVTVHRAAFAERSGDAALQAVDAVAELELVEDADGIRLYRLK